MVKSSCLAIGSYRHLFWVIASRKKENVYECSIPLPEESVALAQLAEQASQSESSEG